MVSECMLQISASLWSHKNQMGPIILVALTAHHT